MKKKKKKQKSNNNKNEAEEQKNVFAQVATAASRTVTGLSSSRGSGRTA